MTRATVTVVGGGLAGLVAAVSAAEAGAPVELHEARSQLGGRARTAPEPWRANWGPHALYCDGPLWAWLAERDLLPPCAKPPSTGFRVRVGGEARRRPPAALVRSAGLVRQRTAPVDVPFRDWVASRHGDEAAARWSAAAGVVTFCHDPGALSAAFVWERLRRNITLPPVARYPIGGWASLVERLAARATELGVRVETRSSVDSLPDGPTVVAVELPAARRLLGDDSLAWTGARTALLDVGMRSRDGDPFIVADLDEPGWAERFSAADPTLAPSCHSLVQAQVGMRPGEGLDAAVARAEALLDAGYRGWREREAWRRRAGVDGDSGAVDLPGTTWRDRPAVARGGDVWLAGDMVAAPGLLAEVSWASGVEAGRAAAAASAGDRLALGAHRAGG
jgi:phytoene dehydrogenase-like protein